MKKTAKQYTIRNIPDPVDRALRRKARESGKSFNQVALEALTSGAGESLKPKRDFSEVIGSMPEKEAARMDEEIRLQRQIDPRLWK
jgi:plasmid stability protein